MIRSNEHAYWNDPDVAADLRARQNGVTEFAQESERLIPRGSRVLELGCGAGDDAAYFAEQGHLVTAIDLSSPSIEIAAQRFADKPRLEFTTADISQPFNVSGQSLDVVYARLSMQYFDHKVTMHIVGEVAWVLRSGGQFFFACRSTDDPLYGKGVEIEPDMFDLNGHVRHFFTPDYAHELLEAYQFDNIQISTGQQKLYGEHSAYVKCSAVKP